jgi:signal transduction histidine kinase/ActR/RegA family two-component response regulator
VSTVSRTRKAFRLQLLPLVAGFVVLAAIVGARALLVEDQQADNIAVRDAFELERLIVQTMSLVQDAETGQRGYMLTGEAPYLAPYRSAVDALPGELDKLKPAMADDPQRAAAFGELRSAISDRLKELADTIAMFQSGDRAGALAMIRDDRGKVYMDRVREVIAHIRQNENAVLQARLVAADDSGKWLGWVSIASLAGVLLLGLFSAFDMRRRLIQIDQSHEQLTATNAALLSEIATRETAEAQVRQMQKMEAIGQLTGGIAHDFNNMLAVVTSAMNLIQRKLARGETEIGTFVESALDATQRAANLTQRLLAFSRQQPLAPQVVDANRLLAGMSDLLRHTLGESIAIETVLGGGLWRTNADPSQIENAVLNLAVNARDAMPDGGRLTIETANCHLDDDYAARHAEVRAGQYVLIAVTDTGTGMPPEVAARAFDPFFTTKPVDRGTGLGLSQVFGFVRQSGGHVTIYSEVGQGTTIKIYLQRYFGEDEHAAAEGTLSKAGAGEMILLVEDDERVRLLTVEALRDLGYVVVHAANAEDALRRLETHPDVALLFTDIVMPGMNGRKLADLALQTRPGLKLLFTTGFTRNAVVHNGVLDHGVNFLAKPFTIDQLADKVRGVLDNQRGPS